MIDFRHLTFLMLCEKRHYAKVAEALHMTQPAVTQHIQFLENQYGCKLIKYEGKQVQVTEKGALLFEHLKRIHADCQMTQRLLASEEVEMGFAFGATLTIGEYVLPHFLSPYLSIQPQKNMKMVVENTQMLLDKLDTGELAFAFIEGYFDTQKYEGHAFRVEPFIAVCSADSRYSEGDYALRDLYEDTLIIREEGSGTREIFERLLYEKNASIHAFGRIVEVGNLGAIQTLVSSGCGISFMYRAAARPLILAGHLKEVALKDVHIEKPFHFVYLKNSIHEPLYLDWFHKIYDFNI